MKRFIYQYTCLVYSFIQFFLFIAMLVAVIEQVEFDKYYNDYGNTIILIVILLIMLFILAIPDKFLRGVKNEGFWVDCLLLTLVSPFRFICQIITIVNVHIAENHGNYSFGKRGNDKSLLSNYIYYYFFNAEHEDPRSGEERRFETKRAKEKRVKKAAERQATYNEIIQRMDRELEEADNFIRANRRSDGRYNVYIVPLCSVDSEDLSTFSVQNNSYNGYRHLNELFVNGKKIIYDMNFDNAVALSLQPGYYTFKVRIKGNVKATGHSNSEISINRSFELKDVYVGNGDVHLAICMTYGSVVTRYTERYSGKFVRDEFDHFNKEHKFMQVSLSALQNVCSYWNAYCINLDRSYTQYSVSKR